MDQFREREYKWTSWPHNTLLDHKENVYCRALNRVQKFNSMYCGYCPLLNGDCREVHCQYYRFIKAMCFCHNDFLVKCMQDIVYKKRKNITQ